MIVTADWKTVSVNKEENISVKIWGNWERAMNEYDEKIAKYLYENETKERKKTLYK